MGRLELRYDAPFRRFIARASIGVAAADSPIGASYPSARSEQLVVDSGSNVTVLSANLAGRLGIRLDDLETRDLAGINGVARRPFVRQVEVFLDDDPTFTVRLPGASIATPDIARSGGALSPGSWKGSLMGAPVSVLGMDVARALRATLTLSFKELKGALEW